MPPFDSVRVHAIILTKDRTDVLQRSVDTAVMKLRRCDLLTVLDDSTAGVADRNAHLLAGVAHKSRAMVTHLVPARLYEAIADVTAISAPAWQCRTNSRDIAPLRNLALLLSTAVGAHTTIFIDDDICDFDLELTHASLQHLASGSPHLIVGAAIGGHSEMDALTRLCDAIQRLDSAPTNRTEPLDAPPFVAGGSHGTRGGNCSWVSAGYMAFNIHPTHLFAFPPGYNEDWLWCLMHDISGDVRIVRSEQVVQHAPRAPRPVTPSDILFELAGDLVFDCLCAHLEGPRRTPLAMLHTLARHAPSPDVLPTSRIAEVDKLARKLMSRRRMQSSLDGYGVQAVEAIMYSRDLFKGEGMILPDWCNCAIAKQRSYSSLPANEIIRQVLAAIMLERRK